MNGSYAYDSWGEINTSQEADPSDVLVSMRNGVLVGEATMPIAGKDIPYRLVLPAGEDEADSLRGMLLLHGGGSSAKDFARFQGNAAALYRTATVAMDFTDFEYDLETRTPLYGDWETRIYEVRAFVWSLQEHPLVHDMWVTVGGGSGGGATTFDYMMRYGFMDGVLSCYPWYSAPPSWMRDDTGVKNEDLWEQWPDVELLHLYGDQDASGGRWFMDELPSLVPGNFLRYSDAGGAWGDHGHGYMTRTERLPTATPYADTFIRTMTHFRSMCGGPPITWKADLQGPDLVLSQSLYRT